MYAGDDVHILGGGNTDLERTVICGAWRLKLAEHGG